MAASIEGNVGIVAFKALYPYTKAIDSEISLNVGDVCYVPKPILNPKGWLTGKNLRTGEYGRFPGNFVEVLEEIQLPPKPEQMISPEKYPKHKIETMEFVKPLWCSQCKEYIWGHGKQCFWCDVCHRGCHSECSSQFFRTPCVPSAPSDGDTKESLQVEVVNWNTKNVLEWLACARIFKYIDLFEENCVNGKTLIELRSESLQKIGIKYQAHSYIVWTCIEELLRGSVPNSSLQTSQVPEYKSLTRTCEHKYNEHTFTAPEYCSFCYKLLFGLVRQGYVCQGCGLQCHRYCASSNQNGCRIMRTQTQKKGSGTSQYTGQVKIFSKIIDSLEKVVNVRDLYVDDHPDFYAYAQLWNGLTNDPPKVTLKEKEQSDPRCLANVLKLCLGDLVEPLIPCEMYDDFLSLPVKDEFASLGKKILKNVNILTEPEKSLMVRLLEHLRRLVSEFSDDKGYIDRLSRVFNTLIFRPKDKDIKKIAWNLDLQRSLFIAMLSTDFSIIMVKPTPPVEGSLEKEEWYFGDITRDNGSEAMKGTVDGTFLVRKSAEPGEYTLTLRMGGNNKLIRITHRDGKCGFTETHPFDSVPQLIAYFRENSLEEYCPNLKTKLLYPLSKYEFPGVVNQDCLKRHLVELEAKLIKFTRLNNDLTEATEKVHDVKVISDAQTEVIYMFEEQIKLCESCLSEVPASEKPRLEDHITYMKSRLAKEQEDLKIIDEKFKECNECSTFLSDQVSALKTEASAWQQEYDIIAGRLEELDGNFTCADEPIHSSEIYEIPTVTKNIETEDMPSWAWMMGQITKEQTRQLLDGKPDGTFLVRCRETTSNSFAISLVHNALIKHIVIEKGPNGYGFAEPYNTYKDIESLIKHYHKQSLRMHNPTLDTTLLFPIKFVEENEDLYMRL